MAGYGCLVNNLWIGDSKSLNWLSAKHLSNSRQLGHLGMPPKNVRQQVRFPLRVIMFLLLNIQIKVP